MRSTHGGINNESEPVTYDTLKQEYCTVPENVDMAIQEEYFEEGIKHDVTLKQEYCSETESDRTTIKGSFYAKSYHLLL